MAELLAPQPQDIEPLYHRELEDMTAEPVSLKQLQDTLGRLVGEIHSRLTDADKHFLLALKKGTADWHDFPLPETERLPAVQWKLLNIQRMSKAKHAAAIAKLEKVLFG